MVAGAAARHPHRAERVVLVDGGLPVQLGPLSSPIVAGAVRLAYRALPVSARRRFLERLLTRTLGPNLERLERTYPSREEYLAFWRNHAALRDHWGPYVEQTFSYELEEVGSGPQVRSTTSKEAVLADSEASILRPGAGDAVFGLRCPTVLIRATAAFAEGQAPIYGDHDVARARIRLPALQDVTVAGTNHYTILLTELGTKEVAEVVRR